MLQLKNIKKIYTTGNVTVNALNDVSVNFRKNEFVAILGQSGSGKTTMLNVIGGLDRYDSGDLLISGRSTKEYKDKDWDSYRNHSIGFIFQSYNLIPHQSVLSNVELALTLAGVSKAERRRRAKEVLEKVGLADQLHKKPNQMSGGQMQRVAIARALINDPDILLADEPTGALDSDTSIQIMDLIREIANDRLVVMVTHNPELAAEYATRIISLKDGTITDDTDVFSDEEAEQVSAVSEAPVKKERKKKKKGSDAGKTSMNVRTALALSFNNLLTKKGRTFLTSFAGSIGIIGIALILSLSNGVQVYIDSIERDAMSSYPITIESQSLDISGILSDFAGTETEESTHEKDKIYVNNIMTDMMKAMSAQVSNNDLGRFKKYIDENEAFKAATSTIKYGYNIDIQVYKADTSNGVYKVNPNEMIETLSGGGAQQSGMAGMSMAQTNIWQEMLGNDEMLSSQYDVVAGEWPDTYDEVVLVVDKNNEINDMVLYALGISDPQEFMGMVSTMMAGEEISADGEESEDEQSFEYDDFLNLKFKLVLNTDYYVKSEDGIWEDMSGDEEYMKTLVDGSLDLKISGIVRPAEDATAVSIAGAVGYTSELTDYVIGKVNSCEIVKEQKANPETDVFSGLPFKVEEEEKAAAEETTTAQAAESTTAAAKEVSSFERAVAAPLTELGAPEVRNVETASMPNIPSLDVENVMTEDEIYEYIDKNTSGEEQERMREIVTLVMKDIRSVKERKALTGYIDEILSGQKIEGMDSVSGSQIYTYIQLMDKDTKLKFLTAVITAAEQGITGVADIPQSEGKTDTAEEQEEQTTEPVVVEPEEPKVSDSTYLENISLMGVVDSDTPSSISIYPLDFEAKETIGALIEEYNETQKSSGHDEYAITYTDMIGIILKSVTTIINTVTFALIAFVAISLVVSSIMIGVITYISVLERTKEIGVLRSLGASKRDISRVFNSETFIVGLIAGMLGIVVTLLLNIPINIIIRSVSTIGVNLAILPIYGGIALVIISVVLTVIAGLIPSKMAAKKDPVVALRTE